MKIIIRYPPGGGGRFISGIIYTMLKECSDISIVKNGSSGHMSFIQNTHNYSNLELTHTEEFFYYSEEEFNNQDNITEGINWFKNKLIFNKEGIANDYHIIPTHARNLNSLVCAIGPENTKIINIQFDEIDQNQIIYNFVYKTILEEPDWMNLRGLDTLENLEYHYSTKYSNITFNDLVRAKEQKDSKFLTQLLKLSWKRYWERYSQYQPLEEFNIFNIHWHELATASLINRLLDLVEFLNITLPKKQLKQIEQSIIEYSSAQKPIMFSV